MIPVETVNEILDRARVEEVVSDFITLKRRGSSYIACCPFHNEKTPSFHVSPVKGIYKCFGCGKAGSAVNFVMEYEHLSYKEALKYLAKKYNIEVVEKQETAEEIAKRGLEESLFLVSDFAHNFFQQMLSTPQGKTIGYAYFKHRGLHDDTIAKYGLGWAPKGYDSFSQEAKKAGYKDEYLIKTGLCVEDDKNNPLRDRFYERVIFPIHSVSGRVIAFGARTLSSDKSVAKYVNSKESEIYVKSRSLYGLYFAKNEISKRDKCYLVEGYLDVLSLHQLGILNVVASSGTSLTVEQVRLIKRFTDNLTIMYDGDSAGIQAALRGINIALKEGLNVKVVLISDGHDPDSYAQTHSLEQVLNFIAEEEKDFILFRTELLVNQAGQDPLKKANLINQLADTIALIPDPVKRAVYIEECSRNFKMSVDIITARVKKSRLDIIKEEAKQQMRRSEIRKDYGISSATSNLKSNDVVDTSLLQQTQINTFVGDIFAALENNQLTGKSERDLLFFLLKYGKQDLEFQSDSEYRSKELPGPYSVASFIETSIRENEPQFLNVHYQALYDKYFDLFYSDCTQEEIDKKMLNAQEDAIRKIATELCYERYSLTVKKFSDSLTTTSSWLVNYVPKAILVYHIKRLENKLREISASMKRTDLSQEELEGLLKNYQETKILQRKINIKLGRDKIEFA